MKRTTATICLIATLVAVSGCTETRRTLIKEKGAPDEFQVYTRAPLSLPPEYGLRPPAAPGSEVRKEDDPAIKARIAITGRQQVPSQPIDASSPGLAVLYSLTGVNRAEPNIRQLVNSETSKFAEEDTSVMEGLMFGDEAVSGTVVDPVKEMSRIRENQALGTPINEGEVPSIERKAPRLLDGIF